MAGIEFSVLARACLTRACLKGRNPGEGAPQKSIRVSETERNAAAATSNWSFITKDARAELARLHSDTSARHFSFDGAIVHDELAN